MTSHLNTELAARVRSTRRSTRPTQRLVALALLALAGPACGQTRAQAYATDPGLAYQLELTPRLTDAELPALQSFAAAVAPSGKWLVVGGRAQGLHGFGKSTTPSNFEGFNNELLVIDPDNGAVSRLATDAFAPALGDALRVTNPQQFHDAGADVLYLVGGYGIDTSATPPHKTTFGTLTALPVSALVEAIERGDAAGAEALIRQSRDDRLAVTGGGLERLGSRFLLVFGQFFEGEFVFDAETLPYRQAYTEALRVFTIDEDSLEIELFAQVLSTEDDRPFHRRDLNVVADIDPASGDERVAVFGGVFQPGALLGYSEPVLVDRTNTVSVERGFEQFSNHYECAVIPVYSAAQGCFSRTFVGGIQSVATTPEQAPKGPNDGLPWINTIGRVAHTPGSDEPWVECALGSTPGRRYLGADAHFLPAAAARRDGLVDARGIVHLDQVPAGARVLVGQLYGGIEADAPQGDTSPTNACFDVYLTHTPATAKRVR